MLLSSQVLVLLPRPGASRTGQPVHSVIGARARGLASGASSSSGWGMFTLGSLGLRLEQAQGRGCGHS